MGSPDRQPLQQITRISSILFETLLRLALGLCAVASGLFLLLARGYEGWLVGVLGGICTAGGFYALLRATQCWRGQLFRMRAFLLGSAAGLILGVCSCFFLSRWTQQINEVRAWQRFQQTANSDIEERFRAYNRAVPEPFQRRQAEVEYLLAMVRSRSREKDLLRYTLDDVQARFGDDPTFDPVRQAIQEALAGDSAS